MAKPTIAEREKALTAQLAELNKNRRASEVAEALDAGWVAQGVRLVDPQGGEEGVTIALSPQEAKLLSEPLGRIAAARVK